MSFIGNTLKKTSGFLSENYEKYQWVIFAVFGLAGFIVPCCIKPECWYIWIIVGLFSAWAGPTAFMLSVMAIALCLAVVLPPIMLIVNICTARKDDYIEFLGKIKKIPQFLLFVALFVLPYFFSTWTLHSIASHFAEPFPESWDETFISRSPRAYCYHNSIKCPYLQQTKYEIKEVYAFEAKEMGYEPCQYCLEQDTKHAFDDWIAVGYFVYFVLEAMLLAWHDQLKRKYKIVRRE